MSPLKSFFLTLLCPTFLLYNDASLVVSAPKSHRARLGEDIVLPCSFSMGGSPIDMNFVAIMWIFQGKLVLKVDNKGELTHPRLSMNTREVPKGVVNMEIKNVTISDIGQYSCTVIYSPKRQQMDIDLSVYATPSVTIDSVEKEDKTRFALCSVTGFYPRDIRVDILKDGTITDDSVLSDYHTNADGSYSVNRTWTIPSDVTSKLLSCSVHHETLTPYLQRDLRMAVIKGENDTNNVGVIVGCIIGVLILLALIGAAYYFKSKAGFQKFSLSDIESPVWIDGEKTALSCKASNCSEDIQTTWVIQFKDGTRLEVSEASSTDKEEGEPLMSREYEVTREPPGHKQEKRYVTSKLIFIPSISRHLGSSMICKVHHGKLMLEKTFTSTSICVRPKFIEPVKSTISHQGDVQLSANLHRFYPQKMQISWFSNKGKAQQRIHSEENESSNHDDTFNLESKCTVSGEFFKDPAFKVTVMWKHESIKDQQSRELSVRDLPWHPKLQNIPIESVFLEDKVLLQCQVSEYFPDALAVKWFETKTDSQDLVDVSRSEKYKIPAISSNKTDNGTFFTKAEMSYKRSDLSEEGVKFICSVEHPSLGEPLQSSIVQYRDTDTEMPTFSINNIYGPQTWYTGEKATLYCGASYCKENPQVVWMVTEADGTHYNISETTSMEDGTSLRPSGYVALRERTDISDKEGLLDVTSSLTFTPSISRHQNVTISCKIVDSSGKSKQKAFHCKKLFTKPTVSNPIKLSLTDSGEVLCSLDIEKFYPVDIQIKWNDKENSQSNNTSQNTDGTYSIHSEFKLPGNFFNRPDSAVRVSWKHDSMTEWETRHLSVGDKEFPWKPEIWDILVPNLLIGNKATLKCEVSNVFPDVLSVKWLKKEAGGDELFPLIHGDKYSISDPRSEKQDDNMFKYKSCLKFEPSVDTDEGAEIICRVEHPALERPVEKSTGPLTIKDTSRFNVGEIQGPSRWIHGEKVKLSCPVSNCSEDTRVTWMVEQTDGKVQEISSNEEGPVTDSSYIVNKDSEVSDEGGLFNIMSSLTFVPSVTKHLRAIIACRLYSDEQTKTVKFQPKSIYVKPQAVEPVKTILCEAGDVLFSLILRKFYPKEVTFSWRSGEGQLKSSVEDEENDDGTFTGHSRCIVPGNQLSNHNFSLIVTWSHESLDGEQSQVLSWRNSGLTWCPLIEAVPTPHLLVNQVNTLQYNISQYFPDDVTVRWYRKEKEGQELILLQENKKYRIPDLQSKRQSDHTYSSTALIKFTPTVKDRESEILCTVSHPSLEKSIERSSGPLQVQGKPRVKKPIKPSLGNEEVIFSLSHHNFYPEHIQIEWHYWSGGKSGQCVSSQKDHKPMLDKTFEVESECRVPEKLLHSPDFSVRVTCRHESMDEEEYKELSITHKDFPWRPNLEMSVPPLRTGEEATIQCRIKNYFPDAVTVTWFRRDKQSREMIPVSSDEKYRINKTPLDRQKNKPYGCTSCVTFSPSLQRDQGVEFICRVGHPSLIQPIQKSTGALQVTEPEQPNHYPQREDMQEHHQDTVVAQISDQIPHQTPDQIPHQISNQISEKIPHQISDQIPHLISENIPQQIPDHRSDLPMDEFDCEMPSDPEETTINSSGEDYFKIAHKGNKPKPPSMHYGPRHAMYNKTDREKSRKNPETKKGASDHTMQKLRQTSSHFSDPDMD